MRAAALLAVVILAGCSHGSGGKQSDADAVLYTIGLSTDPYGESDPEGFGVATGMLGKKLDKVEVRVGWVGSVEQTGWSPRGSPSTRRRRRFDPR